MDGFTTAMDEFEKEDRDIRNSSQTEDRGKEIKLNEKQIEAKETIEGNLLIIASAGTGKTTTIVERYVNLVENNNYGPEEVLMTTFTNKAAEIMKDKIEKRTNKSPEWIGTMHSLFLQILRENADLILKNKDYNLLTSKYEKKKIIKRLLKKKGIDPSKDKMTYLLDRIMRFKNAGVFPEELDAGEVSEDVGGEEIIEDEVIETGEGAKRLGIVIYKEYQKYLRRNNYLDFDDILLLTYKLLEENEGVRKKYRDKFKAIMVDEAQDLNVVQIKILDLLENNNLCLIGDDCQNIYQWRGSSNKLIFDFDKNHQKVTLEDNYRSTKEIIQSVNRVIESLKFKIDKKLECTRQEGREINTESFPTLDSEINYIANKIKSLIESEDPEEIAVLFRTNRIGKKAERVFRKKRIPCYLTRSVNFFEREEVRDILAFLKLKINPISRNDFERISGLLGGVGKVKIQRAVNKARNDGCTLVEALSSDKKIRSKEELRKRVKELNKLLKNNSENPIKQFLNFFDYYNKINEKYGGSLRKVEDKKENIEMLREMYEGFDYDKEGIRDYLDSTIEIGKSNEEGKVTLSTIHSAKGLEWKHVFLIGCNEKILPFYRKNLEDMKKDEELRLFYVAISRAKDYLTITHSLQENFREYGPSQFLEILEDYD